MTLAICICMFLAPLAAWETGGDSVPTTECNDGVDNDRDGLTDGDDPGCDRPYYEDDSENDIYDLGATSVFSNIKRSDSDSEARSKLFDGPSVYYGWKAARHRFSTKEYPDELIDGGDKLNVTWVNGSEDVYRGGNLTWTRIDLTGLAASTDRNSPYAGLIDPPAPGTGDTCGTGNPGPSEGSQTNRENCPEDYGMRKNIELSESLDSFGSQSSVYYDVGNSNRMKCYEFVDPGTSTTTINAADDTSDITEDTAGTNGNGPDYAIKNGGLFGSTDEHTLMEITCSKSGTDDITQVTNREVISKQKKVRGSELTGLHTSGSSEVDVCTSYKETDTYEEYTDTKNVQVNPDTVKAGEDASGGAKDATTSRTVSVDVYYTNTRVDSDDSFLKCTDTDTYYQSCTGTCSPAPTAYSYSTESKKVKAQDANTIDIDYRTYKLDPSAIYSTQTRDDAFNTIVHPDPLSSSSDTPYDSANFDFYSNGIHTDFKDDNIDQGNSHAISRNLYKLTVNSDDNFVATRESASNVDVDGSRGFADGFIAISGGSIVGSSNRFLETEVLNGAGGDYLSSSMVSNQLDLSCPGSSTKCVGSVDVYPENHDSWTSSSPSSAVGFRFTEEGPYNLTESFGVCKTYQSLYGNDPNTEDSEVECTAGYDIKTNCEGDCDTPPPPDICGDEPGEYPVLMEGPEVYVGDKEWREENSNAYRGCLDTDKPDVTKSSCNLRGDIVPEGYVGNVAPNPAYSDIKYEKGGNSPDWEVCLDLRGTGIENEGDSLKADNKNNDIDQEDYGGEWYDLDSETAQQYLRGPGDHLISGGDSSDPREIDYYWNTDINPPQDSEHNPQGGNAGLALEDDCGNERFDSLRCDDQGSTNDEGHGETGTFFSFFEEGLKIEDFHPQGESSNSGNNLDGFTGVVNRLQERSDQLEPGKGTNVYDSSSYSRWEDTRGGEYADSWAISAFRNWSVDSTGTPYPPYSAWYRDEDDIRTRPSSPSREKMVKVFGNSFAAVANESFTYENEAGNTVQVDKGDGVWIDPDMMKNIGDRYNLTPDGDGWRAALQRVDRTSYSVGMKIDLTGEDAGLGVDVDSNEECLVSRDDGGCKVMAEDIDWERSDSDDVVGQLEQPMCGDDRHEYLIEQAGESQSSEQYEGPYACADSRNSCYDSDAPQGQRVVDQGVYRDVDEPGEDVGRLKDDREVCGKVSGQDDYALWYDQDYREGFCNRNSLYGPEGIRWFDAEYVADYPQAVSGGIDDSWNDYLAQIGHKDYDSDPTATESEVTTDGDTTPVPTGDSDDVTATLGFCGGDDESEYLVTQECNTRYCETDRQVQGVAKVPGSCVLRADDSLYETGVSERQIFKPGDQVEVTGVSGDPTIACFNGAWFSDWPVSFNQGDVDVPLGDTRTVSFDVVNIRNSETTFEVNMEPSNDDPGAHQFASFVQHSGDSFTTTVEPTSSKTFQVEITGGDTRVTSSDLTIRADGVNAGLTGSDSVTVDIVEQDAEEIGRSSETEDVPGIQTLQLLALTLISTVVFFTRGN